MRKLLPAFILLFVAYQASAQTIPNGGFENWTPTPLWEEPVVDPSEFNNSNYETFKQCKKINVTKIPHADGSALRLENILITDGNRTGQTEGGFVLWGGESDANMVFSGGFPYSDQSVTGVLGRFNYDLAAESPGMILIQFKKDGVPVGGDPLLGTPFYVIGISGTSTEDFAEMSFSLSASLPAAPDTAVIAFTSFNPLDGSIPQIGKFLEIDSLYLTSGSGNTPIPGGDLDTWMSLPDVEMPDEWKHFSIWPSGPTFSKTTDSYSGMYALQLTTIASESIVEIGEAGMGYYNDNEPVPPGFVGGNVVPGVALNGMPEQFSFAYKYSIPDGSIDTAHVSIAFTKWDATAGDRLFIDHFAYKLPPVAEYTVVSQTFLPGTFVDEPDSMLIGINSSLSWENWSDPQVGSSLIIDQIELLTSTVTGTTVSLSEKVQLFPVPASSSVSILAPSEITAAVVLNSLSSPVLTAVGSGKNKLDLDIAHLEPGVYFIRLETEEGTVIKKVIKE